MAKLHRCFGLGLVCLLVTVSGAALGEERSFAFDSDGWAAVEVDVTEGPVSIDFDPPDCPRNRGSIFTGSASFGPGGTFLQGVAFRSTWSSVSASGASYSLGAHADPAGLSMERTERSGTCLTWKATMSSYQEGRYVFAAWAAAGIDAMTVTVRGGDGVEILGVETGDRAWGLVEADFDGTARAHAYGPALRPWAAVDASTQAQTEDTFVGAFWGVGEKTAQTPDGARECGCWFTDLQRPGSYTFGLTGASALSGAQVTGADLRLP